MDRSFSCAWLVLNCQNVPLVIHLIKLLTIILLEFKHVRIAHLTFFLSTTHLTLIIETPFQYKMIIYIPRTENKSFARIINLSYTWSISELRLNLASD